MSRDITSAVVDEITSQETQIFFLFEAEFASGYVRAWSGYGDLSWSGETWTGAGTLLGVSEISETSDGSANGLSVTMTGIPSELISLALGDIKQGSSGKVWMGFLNSGSIVSDPVLLFEGRLDVPVIDEDGSSSSITISYESRLIDLDRVRETRYTDEEQKKMYPGDKGCEFVASLQDAKVVWGR